MALATITKKQWGYVVGGAGVDATPVATGDIHVKRLLLSGAASADTVQITDAAGTVIVNWVAPVSLTETVEIDAKLKGITVNQSSSAAGSVVGIVVE